MEHTAEQDHQEYLAALHLVRERLGNEVRLQRTATGCPCCAQGWQIRCGDELLGAGHTFAQALEAAELHKVRPPIEAGHAAWWNEQRGRLRDLYHTMLRATRIGLGLKDRGHAWVERRGGRSSQARRITAAKFRRQVWGTRDAMGNRR